MTQSSLLGDLASVDAHRRIKPIPLSLRNDEELLHEPGIEISHKTVRFLEPVRFAVRG
jgi:hypothetical protein